jgi:hypothetical protein
MSTPPSQSPNNSSRSLSISIPASPSSSKKDINFNPTSPSKRNQSAVVLSENGVRINHQETTPKRIEDSKFSDSSHHYSKEETIAFTTHINHVLSYDPLLSRHMPLDAESEEIFTKLGDGLILIRLINLIKEGTISELKVNKGISMSIFQQMENLKIALDGAKIIGCHIVNIGGQDIISGRYIDSFYYLYC